MKPKPDPVSRLTALQSVWEWKDAVYRQTRHLSTAEALDVILMEGHEMARQLNLSIASVTELETSSPTVAETASPYKTKPSSPDQQSK